MPIDLEKFPALAARAKEHEELWFFRRRRPPIRKLQQKPSIAAQALHIAKTVAHALSDVGPIRVELANLDSVGAAASGFGDITDFSKPFILLSNSGFEHADDPLFADAIAGFASHEVGHLMHTRAIFKKNTTKRKKASSTAAYLNLWEDDRIDRLIADKFPATIAYLEAARFLYITKPVRRQLIVEWESSLDEIQKFETLLFAFVRTPRTLVQFNHAWLDAFGENPFEEFERFFPRSPETEEEVILYAKRAKRLVDNFRAKHPANAAQLQDFLEKNHIDSFDSARITRQLLNDLFDTLRREYLSPSKKRRFFPKTEIERLRKIARKLNPYFILTEEIEGIADQFEALNAEISLKARPVSSEFRGPMARLERLANKVRVNQHIPKRKTSAIEIFLKKTQDVISKGFSDAEIKSAEAELSLHFAPAAFNFAGKNVAVVQTVGNPKNAILYDDAVLRQADEIASLRSRMQKLARDSRPEILRQRRRGRIDARQLARASFSERIYQIKTEPQCVKENEVEILVLLDQSGSIQANARTVFDAAVLLYEACNVRGFRPVIYSHSTVDPIHDQPVVYTYESEIRALLPEYLIKNERFIGNCDEKAIQAVAAIREGKTGRSRKRLLIVISDGQPCGQGDPVENTRQAVEALRRRHWHVIGVAVGNEGCCNEIYGANYTIESTFEGLGHSLGMLLQRVLRG